MTRQDYLDWQRHPITESMFTALHNNIQRLCEDLGASAGLDPLSDRFKAGYITACRDTLDVDFADTQETEQE